MWLIKLKWICWKYIRNLIYLNHNLYDVHVVKRTKCHYRTLVSNALLSIKIRKLSKTRNKNIASGCNIKIKTYNIYNIKITKLLIASVVWESNAGVWILIDKTQHLLEMYACGRVKQFLKLVRIFMRCMVPSKPSSSRTYANFMLTISDPWQIRADKYAYMSAIGLEKILQTKIETD